MKIKEEKYKHKVYHISSIKYDTDGQKVSGLPKKLTITVPEDEFSNEDDAEEYVSNEISNITGWCHNGFVVDKIETIIEQVKQIPHNPNCKLIATTIFDGKKFIELVYGINNDNKTNEGLELYFMKNKDEHFYTSRRYLTDEIPSKYKTYFESLQSRLPLMKDGHKTNVELLNE